MIRIFAGYDPREAIGFHVFVSSLARRTSQPFSVSPIFGDQRDGTNAFIYARFLVPSRCNFQGWALFADGADMLVRDDIAKLWALRDERYAVQVVQHTYRTAKDRKYLGTAIEAKNEHYPRKNWSSLILWNCGHPANAHLSDAFVAAMPGSYLHRFEWLDNNEIGSLPAEWNTLVGEAESAPAKIAHYTYGIPWFPQYADGPYADEWRREVQHVHQAGIA